MYKRFFVLRDGEGGAGGTGGTGGTGDQGGAKPWYDGFKSEETKNWVHSYAGAYPDPEAMATKALNLERLLGADKSNRALIVPKDDAKPEEWRAFWSKLGAPEKPEDYKVAEEQSKDPMIVKFREFAHTSGMPAKTFEGIMKFVEEFSTGHRSESIKALEAKAEKELGDLQTSWGADYDKNVELGRRAAKSVISHANADELADTLTKLEGALGIKATMELMANIGKGMGEHQFVSGKGGGSGMTKEGARVRIGQLKADREFQKKLLNKDAASTEEWNKLHAIGFGD